MSRSGSEFSNPLTPRCLSVQQAAAYLGCTVWCVRTLAKEHAIKAVMVGARLLFPREELDGYIDRLKASV